MFVEKIHNFLLEQLSLEHIFDDQLLRILNLSNYLFELLRLKDGIRLYHSYSERQVNLFGVKEHLFHLQLYNL
jgi:hypothetical protein